ncbi:hypothetical protein N431DRAFT_20668 [Stipitochalara longipes BDJ]|nr:hypothetical protein N431DRAFT_20668 [Stipitochalara longipes BDJ]
MGNGRFRAVHLIMRTKYSRSTADHCLGGMSMRMQLEGAGNKVLLPSCSLTRHSVNACSNGTRSCDPPPPASPAAHTTQRESPEMRICMLTAWLPNPLNTLPSSCLPMPACQCHCNTPTKMSLILEVGEVVPATSELPAIVESWNNGIKHCSMGETEKRLRS